jgi:hypothetical protein
VLLGQPWSNPLFVNLLLVLTLCCLQDMKLRASKQQLELLWRPSASWGEAGQVFTQNYPSGNYGPPSGFNFDWGQLDPPLVVRL